jgi:hypothetical protein
MKNDKPRYTPEIMTLEEAMDLVRNEAETSALGDGNEEVMDAVKLLKCFYDEYGYQFKNYENDYHLTPLATYDPK